MFCITFLVRTYISAPLVNYLAPRLFGNRLQGFARGMATTALSVIVTSPITGAATALLFAEADDFLNTYVTALAVTMPVSFFASYFIVGPIVKLLFNNRISPSGGLRVLRTVHDHASSILRLFGM